MPTKGERKPITLCAYTERIPDNLLLEPVEYIFADHFRQIDMCSALQDLAHSSLSAPPDIQTAQAILHSLHDDLSMHIADEELDLFPRLRVRALPDDHFPELLRLLNKDHKRDSALANEVCDELNRVIRGDTPNNPELFHHAAGNLAEFHLSHMEWENIMVLPLARGRLTDEDLSAMGHSMATRRGIDYPEC